MKKILLMMIKAMPISLFAPLIGRGSHIEPYTDSSHDRASRYSVLEVSSIADDQNLLLTMDDSRPQLPITDRSSQYFSNDDDNSAKHANQKYDTCDDNEEDDDTKAKAIPYEETQSWLTVLNHPYTKKLLTHGLKIIGVKKYTVLMFALHQGTLHKYIESLNEHSIGTGDSLLNEAFAEAIKDMQQDTIIRLLSECLNYNNRLSEQTKTQISSMLDQGIQNDQQKIGSLVTQHLEKTRTITEIRRKIENHSYQGPNLLTITAAAHNSIQKLTNNVINDRLVVQSEAQAAQSS